MDLPAASGFATSRAQTLYKSPLYYAATDFAPVGLFAEVAEVLITRKDLPVGNFREFMAYVGGLLRHAKSREGSAIAQAGAVLSV